MRISDWSSDVCSSDLVDDRAAARVRPGIGNLIDLEPEYPAGAGEGEQGVVGVDQPQLVDEILVLHRGGGAATAAASLRAIGRSEEHTSELQSLMRISYAVFCLNKKKKSHPHA